MKKHRGIRVAAGSSVGIEWHGDCRVARICLNPDWDDCVSMPDSLAAFADAVAGIPDGLMPTPDFSMLDLSMMSAFAERISRVLCRQVPRGRVISYGELALAGGCPGGARAVGGVMAGNPFPLLIPCHRVICADGSPGAYGYGSDLKLSLLSRENVVFSEGRVLPCFRMDSGNV